MPITSDTKLKWIDALRSGKYKQGVESLRRGNTYCCLGVLYDVLGGAWVANHDGTFSTACGKGILLRDDILDENVQNTLAEMNDNGYDFIQISDYLEKTDIGDVL